jgi:filamentous hemagglutinin family protein
MICALTGTVQNSRCNVYVILFLALCLPGIKVSLSLAQVTTAISSSGLSTIVTRSGTVYDITGGTRPGSGPNLFHSFGEFSVGRPDTARFLNTTPDLVTSNILGRVTGGNPSNIFGTIQTTGFGNANLFLMNPAGIVFGPNATLNVGGSVNFTTANYIRLFDGTDSVNFYANPASDGLANSVLSVSPLVNFGFLTPTAFGFLDPIPASITIQGSNLSVPNGQGISLVGGNITVQSGTLENGMVQPAQLSAPGGRIHLASVASPGEILAGTLDQAPNINGQSFGALGTIQVSQQSVIDASGDGGGTVLIRGGRFVLDDSRLSANITGPGIGPPGGGIDIQVSQDVMIENGAVLETNVSGNATPGVTYGGVHVKADRIEILGSLDFETETFLFTTIQSNVASGSTGGSSGDIKLEANSILVKDLGQLQTDTGGTGNAGNIMLRTNQNLEINGGFITSGSEFASGNAGNIELTSTHGNILMTNGPFVTSQAFESSGNAGNITVSAPGGDILLAGSEAFGGGSLFTAIRGTGGTGGSGQIQLTANNLTVDNSAISGDNISPLLPGNITVTLSGNLSLSGTFFNSFIRTTSRGAAPAADLNITAHDILLTDGSTLSTETFRSGPGGALNIFAQNLQLTNRAQVRSGSTIEVLNPGEPPVIPSGAGGMITIQGLASPAASVVIDGPGSGIFTDAQGTGKGGNINLTSQSVTLQNGGAISASTSGTAPSATGGSITISAGQSVTVNNGASITASSTGPANAGDIFINAGQNYTSTNSSVTTQASQASGGNITVNAGDTVRLTNSQINASVQGSSTTIGGNIVIDPNSVILQNSQILAQATQGQGGNVSITTNVFLPDANSLVDASSQFGVNGTVTIQSPTSNLSAVWARLQQNYAEASALLRARCAAQVSGQYSSFVVAGRDSLPLEPGGWLPSPMAALSAGERPGARGEGNVVLETELVSLRGLDQNISWSGVGKMPRRFVSILDSACGS